MNSIRLSSPPRRRAFTMVEMLVAIAVFAALLAVVFVPLNLAGNISNIGRAQANTQNSAEQGLRQITNDLNKAIFIFPNTALPGITDTGAYVVPTDKGNNRRGLNYPYYRNPSVIPSADVCAAGVVGAPNTSRVDMLLPVDNFGSLDAKLLPSAVVVSYYCRRTDVTKDYDPINNPIRLYRAQMPYKYPVLTGGVLTEQPFRAGSTATSPLNLRLSTDRYTKVADSSSSGACGTSATTTNREMQWLTMNAYGEFNLEPMCVSPDNTGSPQPVFGSHSLVLPRDVAVLASNARPIMTPAPSADNPISFVPDASFNLSDSNNDGKIDSVAVSMNVAQYDADFADRRSSRQGKTTTDAPRPQTSRSLTVQVNCPNITSD